MNADTIEQHRMSQYEQDRKQMGLDEAEDIGFAINPPPRDDQPLLAFGDAAIPIDDYPGRLIVIEGTDGVGRSTQLALLREYLEKRGFGVVHTAQARSSLAADGLRRAKEGHTLGRTTMDLFYATDFANRLENEILSSLRAGFVVLTDRYIYSMIVRSIVRGGDRAWIEDVYKFAPKPHAVFYLKADREYLLPRVLARGGFDYWESGMDHLEEDDLYTSFMRYQALMLEAYDEIAEADDFRVIDANRPIAEVFRDLRDGVEPVVSSMQGVSA
ncbi:MAG: thymidylate kinase [Planctomycetota bacterium]